MADELNIAATFEVAEALGADQLQQQIADIRTRFPASAHPLFLLFTGSKAADSGLSWCPDCTRAAPVVHAALEEFCPEAVLLVLNCPRAEYKDASFTYRLNERVLLTSVPTLVSWRDEAGAAAGERLGDAGCQQARAVRDLVQAVAAKQQA